MKCPSCGGHTEEKTDKEIGPTNECAGCGAFTTTNPVSGNLIWMLNGRVLAAPQDTIDQFEIEKKRNPTGDWDKTETRLPPIEQEE